MPDGGLAVSWRDVTERRRAAEAEHYLGEATAILASSLEYEETLASLARLVVPRLADWCAVDLVAAAGGFERVAVAHVDPQKVRWAEEIHRRFPPDPDAATGLAQVVRTGRPELVPEITDGQMTFRVVNTEIFGFGLPDEVSRGITQALQDGVQQGVSEEVGADGTLSIDDFTVIDGGVRLSVSGTNVPLREISAGNVDGVAENAPA